MSTHRATDRHFFGTDPARHGLAQKKLTCWVHAPHGGACTQHVGVVWAGPWSSTRLQKGRAGCVEQSPSAAGGEDWVICARTRWLATRVAWLSSAECQVAHGTGHGGTHMHWTVWTGRAVKGGLGPDQLRGSPCSLYILCSDSVVHRYLRPMATLQTMPPTLQSTAKTPTC